ncbi:MAG: hypothetical protein JXR58_11650 [Bacteroidales bacterium]|nr:hypothetical protein [Bacteroidales bacterium]
MGALVKVSKGNKINIEDLSSGLYFLKIRNMERELATKNLLNNRLLFNTECDFQKKSF